jgi:TorA maturation chaperone TorD
MAKHSHNFIETYTGLVGFGFDRETDENTVRYYLQKFSDDALTENLLKRLTDDELSEIFFMITKILKNHLSEPEYHSLFLKDDATNS